MRAWSTGRRSGAVVVSGLVLLATACGLPGQQGSGPGNVAGNQELKITLANVPTLDPQVVTAGMWWDEQGLMEGLVLQNDQGNDVVPGVAEKWTVSSDGTSYTFQIRDNARWSNGKNLTADDFVWAYKRLLTPKAGATGVSAGANSYQPDLGVKGATDYLAGKLTDWSQVGIKAQDPHHLQLTLASPNPDFLIELTHPSMLPLYAPAIEQHPQDWDSPANWVGNGPFVVSDWVKNTSMTLSRNKYYWDAGNVHLSRVSVQLVTGNISTAVFTNHETDLLALDAAGIRQFANDPKLKDDMHRGPTSGLGYLAILRSQNPALQDVRVREALSLALDRASLAKITPGALPGSSLVPSSLPGWNQQSQGTPFDLAKAKQLLSQAGFPDGKGLPTINVMGYSSSVQGMDAVASMWQQNLGISTHEDVLDTGLYTQRRWQVQPQGYTGWYVGSFGGRVSWPYWVGTVFGPEMTEQFSLPPAQWAQYQSIQSDAKLDPATRTNELAQLLQQYASPEAKHFADLVTRARATTDTAKRNELYAEAAKVRGSTYYFIPTTFSAVTWAIQPAVHGVHLHATADWFYLKGVYIGS